MASTWFKWEQSTVDKLLNEGWPLLLALSIVVIGVTLWLVLTQRKGLLAVWLAYLYWP